ncbi:MAG: restriction endonuclease subunit S [Oscillospiraceae bacterium]
MVKKGYKQTEVGIIPNTWQVISLQNLCVQNGIVRGPFGGALKKEIFVAEGYKVYEQGNAIYKTVTRGSYYIDAAKYNKMLRFSVREGDFIVSCSGTIGMIFQIPINAPKGIINQALLKLTINDAVVNPQYFYLYFSCDSFTRRIVDDTQGGAMKNLVGMDVFRNTPFPIPPMPEQKNISIVLADITDLITNLEAIIAKKKAIKQGTMQELLTGKRRLPGFFGEWRYFNLMKNSKVKARIGWQGLKKSEYLDSGYALLVTGTDFDDGRVLWDGCHYVTRSRYEQDRNIQLQNNDILITKDGSLGKAALVQGLTKPATLNSGIFVIRPLQDAYDPVFVYQILSSFVFKNFLDRLSAGSTIIHLYQKDVGKFEFLLPPTIAEQKAIAEALSEMDADIAALENKLTKYRQVKQGMMQQLLTGKIRLV